MWLYYTRMLPNAGGTKDYEIAQITLYNILKLTTTMLFWSGMPIRKINYICLFTPS